VRGIRGATTTESNTVEAILTATTELLETLIDVNNLDPDNIASIFFSATKDLNAVFPARAAREMGMKYTPLLCLTEIEVPGGLTKCIRVLIHALSERTQKEIRHIYLHDAKTLREDHAFEL